MALNQQQLLEIEELTKQNNQTKRPVSLELEESVAAESAERAEHRPAVDELPESDAELK